MRMRERRAGDRRALPAHRPHPLSTVPLFSKVARISFTSASILDSHFAQSPMRGGLAILNTHPACHHGRLAFPFPLRDALAGAQLPYRRKARHSGNAVSAHGTPSQKTSRRRERRTPQLPPVATLGAVSAPTHPSIFRCHATADRRRSLPASCPSVIFRCRAAADGRLAAAARPHAAIAWPQSALLHAKQPFFRPNRPPLDVAQPFSDATQPLRDVSQRFFDANQPSSAAAADHFEPEK